jgi:hypothetical protein
VLIIVLDLDPIKQQIVGLMRVWLLLLLEVPRENLIKKFGININNNLYIVYYMEPTIYSSYFMDEFAQSPAPQPSLTPWDQRTTQYMSVEQVAPIQQVVMSETMPDIDMKIRESEFKMKGEIIQLRNKVLKLERDVGLCCPNYDKMATNIQSRFRGKKDRTEMTQKYPEVFNKFAGLPWTAETLKDAKNRQIVEFLQSNCSLEFLSKHKILKHKGKRGYPSTARLRTAYLEMAGHQALMGGSSKRNKTRKNSRNKTRKIRNNTRKNSRNKTRKIRRNIKKKKKY